MSGEKISVGENYYYYHNDFSPYVSLLEKGSFGYVYKGHKTLVCEFYLNF